MIPIVISALLIGGILSYFYFVFAGKQHRKSTLLVDLGLSEKWSGEETTAFYKWAWTKASGERVWAERIVKNAFQKAEIWLSPDDLGYFESVCNDHAAGKPINQEKLKAKIQSIVKRSEVITHWVSDYVRDVLYQLTRISPDEAERSLRESGMRVESSKALVRYGTVNLRRKLGAVGAKILSVDSKGMKLEDPNSSNTFTLNGFEGWQLWVKAYKQETLKQLSSTSFSSGNKALFSSIRASVAGGLFNDFEEDVRMSLLFRNALGQEIEKKELDIAPERITLLELILYTWKFKDGVPFNDVDHKRLRALLVRKDLSGCFRETLIRKINKDFSALQNMMKKFPRHVIIYGRNKHARRFAAEQYYFHFEQLLGVLASAGGTQPDPPAILTIPESQVKEVQEANIDRVAELTAKVDKANTRVYKNGYLTPLIERHKNQSNMKRKIEEESAESIGYIIDLGLEELTPAEFSELDSGDLRKYIRFSCDGQENTDFESMSHHAKTQRILFFKRVLDTLLDMPAFDLGNPFESPSGISAKVS